MKNWKKRFTSLLLAIVMCLSLGVPALAAEKPATESSELESRYAGMPVCRYESILLAMSSGNVEYLEDGETVYTIHYSTGATETATRTVLNDGSIAYVCEGASGQSVVTLSADGKILLDGHKVRHTTIRYYDCDESTYSMTADTVPYVGRMEVFSKTPFASKVYSCLLYTSDAADEL